MSGAKKKTSVVIDQEIWRNVKKAAIDQNIEFSVFVERALVEALKSHKSASKNG